MSVAYWDRQGGPLTLEGWASERRGSNRIALTRTHRGARTWWVSTVFIGIFENRLETMVFTAGSRRSFDERRYQTFAEALAGHRETVDLWSLRRRPRFKRAAIHYPPWGRKPYTKQERAAAQRESDERTAELRALSAALVESTRLREARK